MSDSVATSVEIVENRKYWARYVHFRPYKTILQKCIAIAILIHSNPPCEEIGPKEHQLNQELQSQKGTFKIEGIEWIHQPNNLPVP